MLPPSRCPLTIHLSLVFRLAAHPVLAPPPLVIGGGDNILSTFANGARTRMNRRIR